MPTKKRRPSAAGADHRRAAPDLTETLEDYLEIVYMLSRRRERVRVRDIARARPVRMPTAVIALRRLAEKGLVRYAAGECAQLTAAGIRRGRQLAERHVFLQRFLQEVLGLPEEIAARDACGLEHHLDPITLERLIALARRLDSEGPVVAARSFSRRVWARRLGDETPAPRSRG
jgi:DtxR family Mn-dependent transcriptional regulator